MIPLLPLNAAEIFVQWRKDECGLGITAFTDPVGDPFMGLYPLAWDGLPTGLPLYFPRRQLMVDVMVGLIWCKPAILFLDAEISARGLDVRLREPLSIAGQDNRRHLWAHWGSPAPHFQAYPANSNWRAVPVIKERLTPLFQKEKNYD